MSTSDEAVLDEHLAAENAHDLDRIMATYGASPVIELGGAVVEGVRAVREFHRAFGFGGGDGASFSDVHVAERRRYRTPGAIVVEQTLSAKHTGAWRGVAPTGRAVSVAVCTVYLFEGGRLVREHVYLDEARLRHLLTRPAERAAIASSRDVILRTPDLGAATRFYQGVLGFPVTLASDGMMGFDTGAIQLFAEKGADARAHGAVFDFLVPDVAAAKAKLVAAGCVVVEEDPRVPRCYLRDPFGLVFNVGVRASG